MPMVSEASSVTPRRMSDEELAEEFWADIGYQTPASRVWERPSPRCAGDHVSRSEAEGVSHVEKDGGKRISIGPVSSSTASAKNGQGAVGVPVMSRVLVKPWIGPIPPPRVSPPQRIGDVMPHACLGVVAALSRVKTPMTPLPHALVRGSSTAETRTPDPVLTAGPYPNPAMADRGRPLRMVNLNRWLWHLWSINTASV